MSKPSNHVDNLGPEAREWCAELARGPARLNRPTDEAAYYRDMAAAYKATAEERAAGIVLLQSRLDAARAALRGARDALDALMGDTDLDGDDSPEFRAMQKANRVLEEMGE